ncbi:bifunctional phosphatase PAP2/diacylglycerol kinase family protein [Actinomadura atramentaria]|uniref:bifunctional phosphatase PAP2/diacylglycerol kinase family protein n=1 Tax=Actinomadura atramentaria TaxID=1990 RepID=UPI000524B65C|nr:bifunctional phosphatase PAP2/diacylglycerol kinase family protein [Actinomadura atramentaria]
MGRVHAPAGLRALADLDRRAFDRVASARLTGLEPVLPVLSRTADHGVLWFAAAAGLAATRRVALRRAALRGVIGIGVASPLVNLLGKRAFRRHRPVLDLVPPRRVRWRPPASHAFPSGHSASAAAFATGVALEAPPAVALPVAAVAGAVAFSRVYTGAHFPGDVLVGVFLGAAVGVGTRFVWPARPQVAKVTRTGGERVQIAQDGQGMVVVVNADSGDNAADGGRRLLRPPAELALELVRRELPAARIVRPDPDDDLAKVLDEAAADAEVLAVIGGDGTVNAAAVAALRHRVPLLPIPGGTFDHFARALGIELPADAVAAYRGGCLGRADVGFVTQVSGEGDGTDDDLLFLNTASFGAYPELVDRRERLEGRLGKWPALAVAAARTLRHAQPVEMVVGGRTVRVWLGFVGNCAFGSQGPAPTWRDRLDDGRLDVRVVVAADRAPRLRALAAVLLGHLHLTRGYRHWRADALDLVAPAGGLRLARDGEVTTVSSALGFGKYARELRVFCRPRRGLVPA